MNALLLVGGGGHCTACIDVIEAEGKYHIRGVVQATVSPENLLGYSAIGSDDDLPQLLDSSNLALVTVGQIKNPEIRIRLFELLKHLGARLPVIVSPRAYFSEHGLILFFVTYLLLLVGRPNRIFLVFGRPDRIFLVFGSFYLCVVPLCFFFLWKCSPDTQLFQPVLLTWFDFKGGGILKECRDSRGKAGAIAGRGMCS